MAYEQQPSPATSTGTSRTNRGGRPKEWTDPRTRRLTRLYCYTTLKVDEILKVLEDEVWSPGKEAANKHLNHLLGKDPRWVRPKDLNEARQRIAGLKISERATKRQSDFGIPRTDTFGSTLDGRTLNRSSGSSLGSSYERKDVFMSGQDPTFSAPSNTHPEADFRNQYHPAHPSLSRFVPRVGTTMTTSTNFSVGSTREAYRSMQQKLKQVNNNLGRPDLKDVFRLLKRFTISNDGENDGCSYSPSDSAQPHRRPSHADLASCQEEGVAPANVARYTLPGEFIGTRQNVFDPVYNTDPFGNTSYHMLAATEGCESQLIDLVSDVSREQSSLNARNTGGETFLHVLHDKWFEGESRLNELVDKLQVTEYNFYAKDVYGRSFFHLLRQKYDRGKMREITRQFNMTHLNSRDAFGVRPMIEPASTMSSRQEGPARLTIPSTDRSQERINDNTRLLKIITGANSTPQGWAAEDRQGRNALHCLAEVVLGMTTIEAHASGTRAPKRKMDDKDEPDLQVVSLSKRLQYLDTVLQTSVDVNHYSANGDTVLMAFVTHIVDGHDDKDLELLLKRLIASGANLEARNRDGETVLQVAARLGRKFAVRVLVEHGANLHVRNCQGRSVLQTIDGLTKMSQDWPELIARLEATRVVLTGRWSKYQAVQDPDLLQEWGIRPSASPSP